MSSQPDSHAPQAAILWDGLDDAPWRTEGLAPECSHPREWEMEMTRADFDPLSLFPSEGGATADVHSEGAYPPPGVHTRKPAPAPARQADPVAERDESEALEDLREQLCQTVATIQDSLQEASALRTDLYQVRGLALRLTQDYETIKEASREARESSGTAMAAIKALEQRLAACDVLAEAFTHKAVEAAKHVGERPVVDASRRSAGGRTPGSQSSKLLGRTTALEARVPERVRTSIARSSGSLLTRLPSWAVAHRADLLARVGVLALVSLANIGSAGDVDRTAERPAQPIPSASIPWTPGTMMLVAAGTGTPLGRHSREGAFETPPVRATEFMGTLAVQSDPVGAAVFLNRRLVGATPLRMPRLSAGSHAVWVERAGYERWTAAILVPANKLTEVSVRLRRDAPARLGELAKAP